MDNQLSKYNDRFITVGIVLALVAAMSSISGMFFITYPFASMSIILVILSKQAQHPYSLKAKIALITSILACLISTAVFFISLHTILTDPNYRKYMNDLSLSLYGQSFDDSLNVIFNSIQ